MTSCNKNNQRVKDIGGEWSVDTILEGTKTVSTDNLPQGVVFETCKVSRENCRGEWTAADGSTFLFTYQVVDKGDTLIWGDDRSEAPATDQAHALMAKYAGAWKIERPEDQRLVLTSDHCAACTSTFRITMFRE